MAHQGLKPICKFFGTPSIKAWIKLLFYVDQIRD